MAYDSLNIMDEMRCEYMKKLFSTKLSDDGMCAQAMNNTMDASDQIFLGSKEEE